MTDSCYFLPQEWDMTHSLKVTEAAVMTLAEVGVGGR